MNKKKLTAWRSFTNGFVKAANPPNANHLKYPRDAGNFHLDNFIDVVFSR